ncbi:uncharacterized protein LOC122370838 [Amphibalanus amphitrite]|uniref:uncharacterized protein LOC122370838 n=1 Tax=Amphibalanus amphitrite TaxID=1232801 RepID=UPI001C91946F|nr:uncharacterized protein LOC122370838 [Amphibalanus amphitrite]
MTSSALLAAWLAVTLVSVVRSQLLLGDGRLDFLDRTATWREAHEQCRLRHSFLVPSQAAFDSLVGLSSAGRLNPPSDFWIGAKYLRNGYFEWLLQDGDYSSISPGDVALTASAEVTDLCARATTIDSELSMAWTSCNATLGVVCFRNEHTDAEQQQANYKPSFTAQIGAATVRPSPAHDEVVFVDQTSLETGIHINITCGPGDTIVKDHFVLGRTRYISSWWNANFTIFQQFAPRSGNVLSVGTFWCRRYVTGAADPVISGRLHVASSGDMYVLTTTPDGILETLQLLELSSGGPALGETSTSNGTMKTLGDLLNSVADRFRFVAAFDYPGNLVRHQEYGRKTPRPVLRKVSLIIDIGAPLDAAHFQESIAFNDATARQNGTSSRNDHSLREVFRCPIVDVEGHMWQTSNSSSFTPSYPPCVTNRLMAVVERRCMPSFGPSGAQWGPFCAAGVCQSRLHRCEPPPPACPPGFVLLPANNTKTLSGLCVRVIPNVSFEERTSACHHRHPFSIPWIPQERVSWLSSTIWLPFQRLWPHGSFLPAIRSLLITDDGQSTVNLQNDQNCTVMTQKGLVSSSSCTARHGVACVITPLLSPTGREASQGSIARQRICQPEHKMGTTGIERCFALICPSNSSRISWAEASALCTRSGSTLASLTLPRYLDAVLRLSGFRGRSDRVAVQLERHDGRVTWRDLSSLTYPGLSPFLSTDQSHTHGVLDVPRGQYDFVTPVEKAVGCALCEEHAVAEAAEIVLFYDHSFDNKTILANVTSVQNFVEDWNDDLICMVSTSDATTAELFQNGRTSSNARDGFRVKSFNVISDDDGRVFVQIFPSVDFGYLTCGLLITELGVQITSNSLLLTKRDIFVQEYVVGVQETGGNISQCELTLCGPICPCFNLTHTSEVLVVPDTGQVFQRRVYPLRVTSSSNGDVTAHYYITLEAVILSHPPSGNASHSRTSNQKELEQAHRDLNGVDILMRDFKPEYFKPARCCPAERTQHPVPLSWPKTCGGTVFAKEQCVDGSGRRPLRHCQGTPLTGVQWSSVDFGASSCAAVSSTSRNLYQLSKDAVTTDNVSATADELQRLTAEPASLDAGDVVSAADILENIAASVQRSRQGEDRPIPPEDVLSVHRKVVEAASQLMNVDQPVLKTSSLVPGKGSRIANALEDILETSVEGDYNIDTENIAVLSEDIVGIASSSNEITNLSVKKIAHGADMSRFSASGMESSILLENKRPNISVAFVVYRNGRLLQSPGQRVTSQVVSAVIPGATSKERALANVLMTFRSLPGQCAPPPTCAFWDSAESRWSTTGCWLVKVQDGSDFCRCNHLTNFARIFNYERDEYLSASYHHALDILTYIGSCLSLLGLVFTMLTFVLFKKWRKLRSSQIVMHMSVALTGVYVTFLGGLGAKEHHDACVCLSALLHFFLLATFGWMCVEAVFQYLLFVKVVGTYIPRFMHKASGLVWGGSLVPVVCVLASRPHCYDSQERVCWMDFQSFRYALVLPMLVLMVINAALYVRIVCALYCGRERRLRTNQPEQQLARRRLRVSMVTPVMLGLAWIFGFLAVREGRLVFALLFCICSTLQGFAVFLLMVAGEGGVWTLWHALLKNPCCRAIKRSVTSASAMSTGATPSSGTSEPLMSGGGQCETGL